MVVEGEIFYRKHQVVQTFSRVSGWQHAGEELTLRRLAPLVRSKRILDIGVGGGRTIPLLTLLSDHYVGIDYSKSMVAACKRRYPDVDVRIGDARELSGFDSGSFEFVFFSYNGIDTMDEQGRQAVFQAVHRVLDERGLFAFSTLNKDGPSYRESPFQLHRPGTPWDHSAEATARLLLRNARDPRRVLRRSRNWREARSRCLDHGGWATSTLAVTDFTLVDHFVTLSHLQRELIEAGFAVVAIYGSDEDYGPLSTYTSRSTDDSFYAVAQRS